MKQHRPQINLAKAEHVAERKSVPRSLQPISSFGYVANLVRGRRQ